MLAGAWQIGQALYGLVRLEAGAQSLPASIPFLWASLSLYGLSEFGLGSIGHGTNVSLLAGLIAVLLLVVLTTAALSFAGYSSRVMQTLSALAAAGAVVDCSRFVLQLLLGAMVPVANFGTFMLFRSWSGTSSFVPLSIAERWRGLPFTRRGLLSHMYSALPH